MCMDGFNQKREEAAERNIEVKELMKRDAARDAYKALREYYMDHFDGEDMAIQATLDHLQAESAS